eukprot:181716-Pelagomonas_calceolata.AAC.1
MRRPARRQCGGPWGRGCARCTCVAIRGRIFHWWHKNTPAAGVQSGVAVCALMLPLLLLKGGRWGGGGCLGLQPLPRCPAPWAAAPFCSSDPSTARPDKQVAPTVRTRCNSVGGRLAERPAAGKGWWPRRGRIFVAAAAAVAWVHAGAASTGCSGCRSFILVGRCFYHWLCPCCAWLWPSVGNTLVAACVMIRGVLGSP